jgi:DNA invertase Pin-like site-specific DNA recombinase
MDKNIKFKVAELPNADEFQLHIYSALAQQERKYISLRTKEALEVVKALGKVLGWSIENKQLALEYDQQILPHIRNFIGTGSNQTAIAEMLTDSGLMTIRSKAWTQKKVSNFMMKKHSFDLAA